MATANNVDVDEVQFFDVGKTINTRDELSGRVEMARSPNSFIGLFQTRPRGGETHIHQHPDSDQILFILKGELTVEGLSGKFTLNPNQGVLIPAGVHYGFTNTTQEDVIFLTMRTEATGGRRVAYVPNPPSNVHVKIPAKEICAKGIGRHIYVYAMNRSTIGISPVLMDEWNKASLLRMNCQYEKQDDYVVAELPQRLVRWYQLEQLKESDYRLVTEAEKIRVRMDITPLVQR
ncbi:MAG: cupin domain-containing protein [Candidatus Binatia bacterium]